MISSSLQRRLLATSTARSAFVLTAGRYTLATLATALSLSTEGAARELIVPLGPHSDSNMRKRGAEIDVFGEGADNATLSLRVWRLKWGIKNGSERSNDFQLNLLGTVVCTLSAAVGAASGDLIASTSRLADTYVLTRGTAASSPKGIADALDLSYNAPAINVYSPADDTPGKLFIPDAGGGDLLLEPIVTSATGANALVETVV